MNISKEGIAITKRFFEAIDMLKAQKRMRGLLTYTKGKPPHSENKKKELHFTVTP